jgi:hypothetical protein
MAATRQENINQCPDECTTKVKLLKEENEFSYVNGQFELKTPVWNKANFEVLWKYSCQSYTCDYSTYSATDESWNVVASTCLCLKETFRQNLIGKIDNSWKRCPGNSSLSRTSKPLECQIELQEFDDSEYELFPSVNQIKVSPYDVASFVISRENKTYCFGPSWTEDDDEIVKMKLFYCVDPKPDPNPSGYGWIIGLVLGIVAVIIIIIVVLYVKFRSA